MKKFIAYLITIPALAVLLYTVTYNLVYNWAEAHIELKKDNTVAGR